VCVADLQQTTLLCEANPLHADKDILLLHLTSSLTSIVTEAIQVHATPEERDRAAYLEALMNILPTHVMLPKGS
jgi:hypothetical protein